METQVAHWLRMAEYDTGVAESLYESGHWIYVVFMCHLGTEKLLKAHVVRATGQRPPKIHSLERLAALAGLNDVPEGYREFLAHLTAHQSGTRYSGDDMEFGNYTQEIAKSYLDRTKEVHQWLRAKLQS